MVTGSYALASDDAAVWRELLGVQHQGHGLIGMDAWPRDPHNGWIGIGNGTSGPWSQRHAEIMQLLASRDYVFALSEAWRWRDAEPSSELALLAFGEVAQAMGMTELADRAHGSLVDLYPSRTDFRRLVDERRARAP